MREGKKKGGRYNGKQSREEKGEELQVTITREMAGKSCEKGQ